MIVETNTAYGFCLEANMRVLDLRSDEEEMYFTYELIKEEFLEWLTTKRVKPNSTPRKTAKYLEYRMYGIVLYNISSIQAGIQFGHAVVEYQQRTMGSGLDEVL